MAKTNQDIVGEKCIRNDRDELAFDDNSKKEAWSSHYTWLLNEEFEWSRDDLITADPVEGPAVWIQREWVKQAITEMKCGKAAGPSGIVAEMLKASGERGVDLVTELTNSMVYECAIPSE